MVNNGSLVMVVRAYVIVAVGTVAALGVLSVVAPAQATPEGWWHAVITAVFAVVLPLRLRAARAGRRSGLRAVGLISAVLLLVNVVGALVPGFFPGWMRVEMVGVAALLAVAVWLVVRGAVSTRGGAGSPGAAVRDDQARARANRPR